MKNSSADRVINAIEPPLQAICPRCGYDQRGAVAAWREQCPLEGQCSECGLSFHWRELYSLEFQLPRWSVEHVRARGEFIRQVVGTLAHSFMPRRFWSSIRMQHPPNWKRLALYLLALCIIAYAAMALTNGVSAWKEWRSVVNAGLTPSTSGLAVFAHAATQPFSNRSIGTFRRPIGPALVYVAPLHHARFLWLSSWPFVLYVLGAFSCCGLAFAALPISRRRAKVKWSHIVRITLYSYGLILPAVIVAFLTLSFRSPNVMMFNILTLISVVAWLLLVPWALIWWSMAASRYLKMEHPWAVSTSVVVLGALAPFSLMVFIWYTFD